MICSRCNKPIVKGERWVDDPCCSAPDCENTNDKSHYQCLPRHRREIEDMDIEDSYAEYDL